MALKGDFERRRAGWCKAGNKSPFSECGNADRFKANALYGFKRKGAGENPTNNTKGARPKGQEGKECKCGSEAVKVACLEMDGSDPAIEEIPENEVNVATGKINLANAFGVSGWGRKNWAEE